MGYWRKMLCSGGVIQIRKASQGQYGESMELAVKDEKGDREVKAFTV